MELLGYWERYLAKIYWQIALQKKKKEPVIAYAKTP